MKNSKNKLGKSSNNNLNENTNYVLYNTSNYKPLIENSVSEILNKFVEVIIQYIRLISEKNIIKNKRSYHFIFERGIETLIHVFCVTFYYTKNLDLTFYHSQKAYYFYIEFIEQISDDNITFLQLSSQDAILFVYKKTIFDLNNEYKKNIQEPTSNEKHILTTVDLYTHIYKKIVLFIINHYNLKNDDKNVNINGLINKSLIYIKNLSELINKNKIKSNYIECIYIFISLLKDKKIEILDFFEVVEEFIKKCSNKHKFDEKTIKNKIYESEINSFIDNNELNKVVEWIFS
jgi:hypothetical protein